MGGKIQATSPLKVNNRFTPKTSCILLERVSYQVVQIIVKFQILDFCQFFIHSIGLHVYGSKSFK